MPLPMVLGHEGAGIVVEIGSEVKGTNSCPNALFGKSWSISKAKRGSLSAIQVLASRAHTSAGQSSKPFDVSTRTA